MTSISGYGGGSSSLIQMLQAKFKEADKDGDNALSLDEFSAAGAQGAQGAGGPPTPDPSELFGKIDSDGDGSVSKDEFTSAFAKFDSGSKTALLDAQEQFGKADANGDGSLTQDEFAAAAPKGPPPGGHGGPHGPPRSDSASQSSDISDIFDALDTDDDGAVSKDEFLAALDSQDDTSGSGGSANAQVLNLLKQASDLYASLTTQGGGKASTAAVTA